MGSSFLPEAELSCTGWLEQMAGLKVLCRVVTRSVLWDAPRHPATAAAAAARLGDSSRGRCSCAPDPWCVIKLHPRQHWLVQRVGDLQINACHHLATKDKIKMAFKQRVAEYWKGSVAKLSLTAFGFKTIFDRNRSSLSSWQFSLNINLHAWHMIPWNHTISTIT